MAYSAFGSVSCLSYRQRLPLAATRDECEPLRFDGDAGLLYVLLNIPEMNGNGASEASRTTLSLVVFQYATGEGDI